MAKFMGSLMTLLSTVSFGQTLNEVAEAINNEDIRFKKAAMSVMIHETGNGKSKVFKNKNNAFGIRKGSHYQYFQNVAESVAKFKKIHDRVIRKYHPQTNLQFLSGLCKCHYASDVRYYTKVQKYFNRSSKLLSING